MVTVCLILNKLNDIYIMNISLLEIMIKIHYNILI